ncbi:TPA: hypothetical protein DEO28_03980 [Candidatus Dependentiae bacterium]|nr:MAG: hypothetical protein UR14_C0006G0033 [candidate division TM6 bacterium GW2011_GWE2_31_21]KKP53544.1 MAG: hypothetical protein UR43_C0004G0085 [candidate division TM6 bacterium GW2011_GWF2_33_332]HBS48215.1 hypothetical protein [Candidatus Dependentiae bacterium]HBZ73641.1 hypothetical protein [Candidatus Dependentiae bacterium]
MKTMKKFNFLVALALIAQLFCSNLNAGLLFNSDAENKKQAKKIEALQVIQNAKYVLSHKLFADNNPVLNEEMATRIDTIFADIKKIVISDKHVNEESFNTSLNDKLNSFIENILQPIVQQSGINTETALKDRLEIIKFYIGVIINEHAKLHDKPSHFMRNTLIVGTPLALIAAGVVAYKLSNNPQMCAQVAQNAVATKDGVIVAGKTIGDGAVALGNGCVDFGKQSFSFASEVWNDLLVPAWRHKKILLSFYLGCCLGKKLGRVNITSVNVTNPPFWYYLLPF